MRLLELVVNDFGVFRGEHRFNFDIQKGNIILFGGKNGSGKTTLLESIRLCLYGSQALGRISQREYSKYIQTRFHRNTFAEKATTEASVQLTFEYAQLGHVHEYQISRHWAQQTDLIKETLLVKTDDKVLTDLSEDRWQDFIQDLIPIGVAELFFFDGEKIKDLATDELGDMTLSIAMKQMLNLAIIEKAQEDLVEYDRRQKKEGASSDINDRLKALRDICEEKKNALIEKEQALSSLKNSIGYVTKEKEKIEEEISRQSSGFALKREKMQKEKTTLDTKITLLQEQIRNTCSGLLPFTLLPELCTELQEQLNHEEKLVSWNASIARIKPKIEDFRKSSPPVKTDNKDIQGYAAHVENFLTDLLSVPQEIKERELVHQLSNSEKQKIDHCISQTNDIPDHIGALSLELEKLEEQRNKLSTTLTKIPKNNAIAKLLTDFKAKNDYYNELEVKKSLLKDEIKTAKYHLEDAVRQHNKVVDEIKVNAASSRRLELSQKVKLVLAKFYRLMTEEKVVLLENLLLETFNKISRKTDFIEQIEIDSQTFAITLFEKGHKKIERENLSAGEKQIFAIATLWALRQLSGRPLPIVIDTPLGRLDTAHRHNLVHSYFPNASHQIILFSTDTEIEKNSYEFLKPNIGKSFLLEHSQEQGCTQVSEGYFWECVSNAT